MAFLKRVIWVLSVYTFSNGEATIHRGGILFPRESETRQVLSLDGLWNFVTPGINYSSSPYAGFEQHWYKKDLKAVSPEGSGSKLIAELVINYQ